MHPVIELPGLSISTYFISIIAGLLFAIGLALLRRRAARLRTPAEDVIFAILCFMIGALIGAKAFQLVGYIILDGRNPGFWTLEHWKGTPRTS